NNGNKLIYADPIPDYQPANTDSNHDQALAQPRVVKDPIDKSKGRVAHPVALGDSKLSTTPGADKSAPKGVALPVVIHDSTAKRDHVAMISNITTTVHQVQTQDVTSTEKITAPVIAPTTDFETQDVTAIEEVVAPAITPVAVESKQAPETETQDVSKIEKITAPVIAPVETVKATTINAPVVSASKMKSVELASQVSASTVKEKEIADQAATKAPAITASAYRSVVTEEQSALVIEEPHSTAAKRPAIQATAITTKASAPIKASTLTPAKHVVAASTLIASTKPVEQVKQVQPTVTYVNQGMTAKDRGELLATSHAVRNVAKRQSDFEQNTNKRFSDLNKEVSDNKKEANAGISEAMAMANIPQVIQGQTVAIGAGMGGYNGENAVAVGVSTRLSQNVIMKATVSDDTESNVGYGAGVSIGW
ncbi:YadA-like family protein, partial [Salmonella enterica]|nr:YadA-like family protein [Salmonella enterica]